LKTLRNALHVGTCMWKLMSKSDNDKLKAKITALEDAGEMVGTARRQRSDAGVKRKAKPAAQREDRESGDDDEDEARRPKKKAKALPKKKGKGKVTPKPIASKRNLTRQLPPVPKSKAIVNSSEDSDDDEDT
jgi:hypothetical protein